MSEIGHWLSLPFFHSHANSTFCSAVPAETAVIVPALAELGTANHEPVVTLSVCFVAGCQFVGRRLTPRPRVS